MAKEYIEREAVCKECIHCEVCDYWEKEAYPNDCEYNDGEPCEYFKSAADVAHVVRCKDCIISYYHSDGDFVCGRTGVNVDDDDFCSYGERRDNNAAD